MSKTKGRTYDGIFVPACIDFNSGYNIHSVSCIQNYTWEVYDDEYNYGAEDELTGAEDELTFEQYAFFRTMFDNGDLRIITDDRKKQYVDGHATVGSIDGSAYMIICKLPINWDTGY